MATAERVTPGRFRYAWSLVRFAGWLLTHRKSPVPDRPLGITVPADAPGVRVLAVEDIADALRVPLAERDGVLFAERRFGALLVQAHVVARDYTRLFPCVAGEGPFDMALAAGLRDYGNTAPGGAA